jgi:PAS domain S-box-containing protein
VPGTRASHLSEFVISVSALLTVYYFDRLNRAKLRSEQALRSSEAHFRSLIENAIDIVAVLDAAGRFVYVSPSVERLLGYTPAELIGRISLELVHEEDRASVAHEFGAALGAPGTARAGTCRMRHKDGSLRMLQSRGGVVLTPAGEKHGLLNLRDVSAELEAEAEKVRLQAQLYQAQKMETLGSMAGGIAHDFNNILTPILGSADLARAALPPHSASREHITHITDAAQRAKALVQRVLLFSRKAEAQPEPVDLARAVSDVLELLRPSLPKNIEVRSDLEPNAGLVLADLTHVHQVLLNLCTNAAYAMREHGGRLSLRVQRLRSEPRLQTLHPALGEGRWVLLEIADTGVGMDAATLERAFEPFFSTKKSGEASGLGLSIVHGIVRSLGGVIDVQSTAGRGTSFSVCLPINEELTATRKPAAPLSPRPSQGRVLLVDDDRAVLAVCRELLELLGYDVLPASDPHSALERFKDDPERFDAVVTDQTMPKMTGIELAEALVRIRASIPIVLTTGFAEADVLDRRQRLPIAEVVSKPYSLEELGAALSRALHRGRSDARAN